MKTSVIMLAAIMSPELYDLTSATLKSLEESRGIGDCEIVIVDNGSSIGGDQLQRVSDIYIRNKQNLGFTPAVNQGIKLATGKLLAIANNDIRVSPNWLMVAREIFGKLPKAGSVHYRMIPYNEPMQFDDKVWIEGKERWCHSSFYVIRRSVFDKIGLYDEEFKEFGYEDWDFWYRVRRADFRTAYTNLACFQHKDSSTADSVLDQGSREKSVQKNREYFKGKHGRYPEDLFRETYPKQFKKPWKPFP